MSDTQVTDNTERHRFEITSEGAEAGFAEYELSAGVVEFTHTVVHDGFEGQGIGGTLVRHALDSARSRDLRVVATCSFVKGYVDKHPEYADLVG
ncbi:GNAT family N-acetyltransferase [Nocardioides sp.]|uniref:GNAT family N-acetyltransferase n=1 Tax=Nocardioides sp. TaxID=35761 RepID=UPI00286CCAB2|nr:GNAT family N-acetyltransferase [Nocardioides sp.]